MSGNVYEWCWGMYSAYNSFKGKAEKDPLGTTILRSVNIFRSYFKTGCTGSNWVATSDYIIIEFCYYLVACRDPV